MVTAQSTEPDVVAVTLMFSSAYEFFHLVIPEIRTLWPSSRIIVGGMHASNTVDFLFSENDAIDYVLCGEGEAAFVEFLHAIYQNRSLDIKGLHTKDNIKKINDFTFEKTDYVEDLNFDYTKHAALLDMEKYTSDTSLFSLSKTTVATPSFAIMTSRGCPYLCTFCASHSVHGRSMRHRDMQNVIDEVYWLNKTYGVNKIYLMDDIFLPREKALELFETLRQVEIPNFDIVIQNMSINATTFEIIDSIANAGITNLAFAIETGSKTTQKKIKKYVKLDKAKKLIRYAQEKGLNVRCFYIIGFVGETVAEMNETFEVAKELAADWSSFSVASPIPGSELYQEFVELGYIEDGPASWKASTIRDRLFDTKEISAKDIKEVAYRGNLEVNFINNTYIQKRDYVNAEIVFSNFVKQYNFHIFGYDCLRRIYNETDRPTESEEMWATMVRLLQTNSKARSFAKYFDLLEPEVLERLEVALDSGTNYKSDWHDSGRMPFDGGISDIV